jgi:hypothetical protein
MNMTELKVLGDEGRTKYNPNLVQKMKEMAEARDRQAEIKRRAIRPGGEIFSLETIADGWRITGVQSAYGSCTEYDLQNRLLPLLHTQDELAKYTAEARKRKYYGGCSLRDLYPIFRALWLNRDGDYKENVEAVRRFLNESLDNTWLNTLTRVIYAKTSDACTDLVLHDYGVPGQTAVRKWISGSDEPVRAASDKAVYAALLGTKDTPQITDVFSWISGKDVYLFRWKGSIRKEQLSKAVTLGIHGNVKFGINANTDIEVSRQALGVRLSALRQGDKRT